MLLALLNASLDLGTLDLGLACLGYGETHDSTRRTPLFPSLLKLPLPRPPARTWAFITDGPSGGILDFDRGIWRGLVQTYSSRRQHALLALGL